MSLSRPALFTTEAGLWPGAEPRDASRKFPKAPLRPTFPTILLKEVCDSYGGDCGEYRTVPGGAGRGWRPTGGPLPAQSMPGQGGPGQGRAGQERGSALLWLQQISSLFMCNPHLFDIHKGTPLEARSWRQGRGQGKGRARAGQGKGRAKAGQVRARGPVAIRQFQIFRIAWGVVRAVG